MAAIKVRVGQSDAIKVISSQGGGSISAQNSTNVIGGIASVTQLQVTGVSTFLDNVSIAGVTTLAANGGITTTGGDLYVGGDLFVGDDILFDEINGRNLNISGISTLNVLGVSGIVTTQHLEVTGIATIGGSTINDGTFEQIKVAGVSTFVGQANFQSNITLQDNDKILLGNESDIEIYHNNSNAYITNDTGNLYFINNADDDDGGDIIFQAKSGKNSAIFRDDEGVSLYYDNIEKLTTTSSGLVIFGSVTATSFKGETESAASFPLGLVAAGATFSGNVSVGGTLTYEDVTNIDSVGLITARSGIRINTGGLVVTAGVSTFAGIATFTNDVFMDGTLTAGLIDGGSF
tara:strand:- start:1862 stop:2905 length:1044 start_codon:yes stop_codon:yes gene_type:complete